MGWRTPASTSASQLRRFSDYEPVTLEFRTVLRKQGEDDNVSRFVRVFRVGDDDFSVVALKMRGIWLGKVGPYVPAAAEVERLGREILSTLYPEFELGADKDGVRQLSWSDPHNGGFHDDS